jgi:hypothetical protein
MENKFAYKVLLSLLQLHPCYLLNIYKSKMLDDLDFVSVVFDVLGDMQNDKRKYRIFMSLAMDILRYDLQNPKPNVRFDLDDPESTNSVVFMHLFIGFQNQFQSNILFVSKL